MMRGQTFQSTDAKQYKTSSNRLLASVGDNYLICLFFNDPQDITMTVLQVGVSHLVLNCEYALKEIPQWTGKT